ncbi:hypothetical protein AVEN_159428-1 [Araneus ventricosus]|uniref:Uncharacterized protein n=1 Tax=Araneus ventricosus TaxID=182803 RepID=A0A4Y2A0Z9_ARAVE|nr:hypothetical protein AVEN_159428-1 [Araneus ventricosus]
MTSSVASPLIFAIGQFFSKEVTWPCLKTVSVNGERFAARLQKKIIPELKRDKHGTQSPFCKIEHLRISPWNVRYSQHLGRIELSVDPFYTPGLPDLPI